MSLKASFSRRKGGFTLIEMLLVIAIIGLLAGVTIMNLDKIFGGSSEDIARLWVNETIKTPLTAYRVHVGRYPSSEEGLDALIHKPEKAGNRWKGPYVEKLPADPWGRPYQYRYPGIKNKESYDVWSMGPSGRDGADDNIGNWEQ